MSSDVHREVLLSVRCDRHLMNLLIAVLGKLYGRGATDDKGPVAGWMNALEAFQKTCQVRRPHLGPDSPAPPGDAEWDFLFPEQPLKIKERGPGDSRLPPQTASAQLGHLPVYRLFSSLGKH